MITKYNEYITEGLRDHMVPKSNEDVLKTLENLSDNEKIKSIILNQLDFELLPLNDKGECVYVGNLVIEHEIYKLPDNLVIDGSLYFEIPDGTVNILPSRLKTTGHFDCSDHKIDKLPDDLYVGYDLNCSNCELKQLPDNLYVGNGLNCDNNLVVEYPYNMTVIGSVRFNDNQIHELPSGLVFDDWVTFNGNYLMEIPDDIIVKGDLYCQYNHIPKNTDKPEGVEGEFYI